MTYAVSSYRQLSNVISAFGLGFLTAVVYQLIVFFRECISRAKAAVFIQDILFSVSASLMCFVFLQIYADGSLRLDLIAAQLSGFAVFSFTAGKAVSPYRRKASSAVNRTGKLLLIPLKLPFLSLASLCRKCAKFIVNLFKKVKGKAQKEKTKKATKEKKPKTQTKRKKPKGKRLKKINKLQ